MAMRFPILIRTRPDPILIVVTAAIVTSFASGAAIGTLANMPPVAQPAQVEPCNTTLDPIACLIIEADQEEEEEPPQ